MKGHLYVTYQEKSWKIYLLSFAMELFFIGQFVKRKRFVIVFLKDITE